MNNNKYNILIIGAGPAGLSAAGQVALSDKEKNINTPSYLILEAFSEPAKTIYQYQKGKYVMDEPGFLNLRSSFDFKACNREEVLNSWKNNIDQHGLNIKYNSEVISITGEHTNFEVTTSSGEKYYSNNIILSIGLQGNPRKLGVSGDDESEFLKYTLDNPDKYKNKKIVVVGAGDAAIENALGLVQNNEVHIINRRNEFSRAKDGNLNAILKAINDKSTHLYCHYKSNVESLKLPSSTNQSGAICLNTPDGSTELECDLIIARLGAIAPRKFVESSGIQFPNDNLESIPDLDKCYQSNVKGLYIIGALGGYPLIKQAMNQGHDVVEFIHGNDIKPADHSLLEQQFSLLPYVMDAQNVLELYQQRVPMFRRMNALSFRELVIESNIVIAYGEEEYNDAEKQLTLLDTTHIEKCTKLIKAGDYIFRNGDYSNTFYTIVEGDVTLVTSDQKNIKLKAGQFFGEMSLLSGRPRQADAIAGSDCILIETPRRVMVKLMNSNEEVESGINLIFIMRALQAAFKPNIEYQDLAQIASNVEGVKFNANEIIYKDGEIGDVAYLIQSGTVSFIKGSGSNDLATTQLQSGQLLGQLAFMGNPMRQHSAKAVVRVEAIKITKQDFIKLVASNPDQIKILQEQLSTVLKSSSSMASYEEAGKLINFLLTEGLGESTNALVIDENLCVSCDNCETACAETHDGVSRLKREQGASYLGLHIPISCRHCEQPHCMKDCPADAIHRAGSGEVFIDDSCIGCGNCETNCPYDVIKMSYSAPKKTNMLTWLLTGIGSGPGEPKQFKVSKKAKSMGKKAVKCDACMDLKGGPACVRSCPTGAAIRINPNDFVKLVQKR